MVAALDRAGRRLGFASTMRNHAAARVVGLHPTDWAALDLFDWAGPITIGELGRQLGLSPAATTALVDRLERSDLVRRKPDPTDRRRITVVAIGDRGATYRRSDDALVAAMTEHARQFTPNELATVLRFMVGASEVLETATADLYQQPGDSR